MKKIKSISPKKKVLAAAEAALNKKALDIVILNVKSAVSYTHLTLPTN